MNDNDLLTDLQCLVADFAQEAKGADIASEGAVWALAKSMLEELLGRYRDKGESHETAAYRKLVFLGNGVELDEAQKRYVTRMVKRKQQELLERMMVEANWRVTEESKEAE